ncbi:hypothetical protein CHS0354_039975 [Potamilus streckersoni]|uniref:Uncharacterized protein n=1 Tax=Potamilus streckersoni TaxID=2493646 RepID=A0AAE0RZW4_9BIVA|nr:hypothetical protein CHS0354_039975 [Potamilus streckersoni]
MIFPSPKICSSSDEVSFVADISCSSRHLKNQLTTDCVSNFVTAFSYTIYHWGLSLFTFFVRTLIAQCCIQNIPSQKLLLESVSTSYGGPPEPFLEAPSSIQKLTLMIIPMIAGT